jgi:peptide/nickel transport system substrate-binding protein
MKLRLRAIPVVAAAILLITGLGACGSSAPTAGSGGPGSGAAAGAGIAQLTAGETTGYANLDPDQTQSCNDNFCGLFMEHLLQLGPNNTLEPELATSVTEPDPTTYEYHLRHGVKFWDGHAMTSADVVYSLDYQRSPKSDISVYFTNVKSITADGPYTVVVKLKQPDAGWKYTPSYEGVIFEKSFAEAHQGTLGNPGVLIQATGPWELTSYDSTRSMELTANPHWWGGKAPIQHITVKYFSTETSMALAMRSGEIDMAFPSNGKTFEAAAGSDATLTTWSPPSIYFVAMNVKAAPFDDIHVRRAVAYALNRTDLIAANGGSLTATSQSTLIPPSQLQVLGSQAQVKSLLNSLPQYPFNLAKAKQELAQSKYPHGFTAKTEIDNYGNDVEVIQAIGAELQKIGINLQISQVSSAQWSKDFSSGNLGGIAYTAFYAASPDPSIFPSYLLGDASTYNMSRYAPPSIDTLMESGLADSSPAQRLSDYGQLLKTVGTDLPYVVLFAGHNYTELSTKYTLPPFSVYPAFSSWALNLKRSAS